MSRLALTRPLLQIKRKEKKKKKQYSKLKRKEISNNDLAILPSHDKRRMTCTSSQKNVCGRQER